jgi:hypothetical protein
MSVVDRIKNAGTIVKAVIGLMTLFPGIAILTGLVEIPPTVGNMIYVISFSVSVLVILSIFLLTDRIQKLSNGRAVAYALAALIGGGVCLTFYVPYATSNLVPFLKDDGTADRVLKPRSPSGEILRSVMHEDPGHPTVAEYTAALQMAPNRVPLRQMMVSQSWSTMAMMLLLLVLSEALLIAPVVGLAWKLAGAAMEPDAAANEKEKAPAPAHRAARPAAPKPKKRRPGATRARRK